MIAKSLISLLCLGILLAIASEASGAEGVRLGVVGGVGLSTVEYDDLMPHWESPDWETSFSAGLLVEIPLTSRLYLQPMLRYARLNATVEYDPSQVAGHYELSHDYLSVPVLVKLDVLEAPRTFVLAGPEVAVLLSAEQVSFEGSSESSCDISNDMDSMNIALDVGAGISFDVGTRSFFVAAVYSYGLLGVGKESEWFSDWKTRAVDVNIGMMF